jgi:DNA repair protein RadC
MRAQSEDRAEYVVDSIVDAEDEDEIVSRALLILGRRLMGNSDVFDNPATVRNYLTVRYARLPHEEFGVVWLDARNRVVHADTLFRGTLTQTSVYPREVVKEGLRHNAAHCIFYHNHPSGEGAPSRSDEAMTRALKDALAMVDIRVLDHLIVAGAGKPVSFAELGLI